MTIQIEKLISVFIVILAQVLFAQPNCTVGKICGENKVCMNVSDKKTDCREKPIPEDENLILPFDSKTLAYCTHSSGEGSHSWINAFWAIDLATNYNEPAATVTASGDGIAYVVVDENNKLCPEPAGTPAKSQPSTCGNSWGNHVKILHRGGYYTMYAHLEKILIQDGQRVKQGQPIGIEGWTGLAGHRHVHWSLQKLPGSTSQEWEAKIHTWAGDSVPFIFKAIQNGKIVTVNTADLFCPHSTTLDGKPVFTGIDMNHPVGL
jgi:hypothetical protein